ncbi:DUF503 domain-containing protein [Clostridium sp. 19966]|uniref:DUF503 domain-containing protein n=1 Tax=Clostridium sp. 19966 TaxID=2768166 RepID=UPI0028DE58CB|nr:DUF503 domain-containing protein [Clostridium sp. 19966]MDT8716368.1 DUF503 domain-containing protein [Clostridium sp. 19966]
MFIGTLKIHLIAEWCHSLKEKRMIVNKIIDNSRHKFNISIGEIEDLDMHNSIILGVALVSNSKRHAESSIQNVLNYIETLTEAVIVDSFIEIL